MSIFNRCGQSRNVLTVIGKWSCVHPMLKVLPVAWDHAIPFGILHPPAPSPMLARFLDAVRAVMQEGLERSCCAEGKSGGFEDYTICYQRRDPGF